MKWNKIINSNSATIFLFLYGLMIQIVAFPVIYFYGSAFKDMGSLTKALIFIWFFIPIVSVFSAVIAIIQIKKRRNNNEKHHVPLIGLILNMVWLLCYLFFLYMVFVAGLFHLTI